ncbi:MAG: right-handed parallel beta-helix repeat-containing protein [Candidatus Heimdallarchaeota archaeon]|nr:right-handed parallel beta-helix repeat-containing protein [Candidatus Heimdallarchaeota archaeon]
MKKIEIYRRKKTFILIMIVVSLVSLNVDKQISSANTITKPNENHLGILALTSHSAFVITNNGNFTDYGFSGTGASDDPFIIDSYNITTTNANGIYITGTTLHFVIQNCYIDALNTGIYVTNVATNTTRIVNNTCVNNNEYGMRIQQSSDSILINNNCTNNYNGFYMSSATGCTLINNTCVNSRRAIWLSSMTSITLINNTCTNNEWGIDLSLCHNSVLINNTLTNCKTGIFQDNSDNVKIENNICTSSTSYGFLISNSEDTNILFNKVMNNNHGIFITFNSLRSKVVNNTISYNTGYSITLLPDSILANNTISYNVYGLEVLESWLSNCTIEYNTFINNENGNNAGICVNTTIRNNYFYNDGLGFSVASVANQLTNTITDNWVNDRELGYFINLNNINIQETIYGQLILINCSEIIVSGQELYNTSTGISVYFCSDITIENNLCYENNLQGIYVSSSDHTIINENECSYNLENGIYVVSTNVTISDNICLNNTKSGIYFRNLIETNIVYNNCTQNLYGIYAEDSLGGVIFHNLCYKNSLYGIYIPKEDLSPWSIQEIKLAPSDSCLITYNYLIENIEYGIYVETDNNAIYNNTFYDNNLAGTSQAFDSGTGNIWYNAAASQGNYWSDWLGTGSYVIDGSAGSLDLYPFTEPIPPLVTEFNYKIINIVFILLPFITIGLVFFKRKK